MKKAIRQQVYEKYNGFCGYTGEPLDDTWQVDHITSKAKHRWKSYGKKYNPGRLKEEFMEELKKVDDIENLMPCLRIINHYKRSLDLEGFRVRMNGLHKRLAKLPKKTKVSHTQKRKEYLFKIAELFHITVEKPFDGKFYFEKLK